MFLDIVKVFIPAVLAFSIGIGITPILTQHLYTRKMWKKKAGKIGLDGKDTPLFNKLHETRDTATPRLGGIIIWFSAAVATVLIYLLGDLFPSTFAKLDFLTRSQTWIPLAVLLLGALVGLVDDLFEIRGTGDYSAGGFSLTKRLFFIALVGCLIGLWFYVKLDVREIGLPFFGPLFIGPFIVPFFMLVTLAIYSGGIIDGIDGLAGGIFAIIFAAYGAVAFFQNQISLAAFCAAVLGGILAFLWFNIPPARFYMSETGSMALTLTLGVVAFMTDALGGGEGIVILLVIALPLVVTSLSVIIQAVSKRFFGRKIFLIAPLHHHFEAKGWPPYKVTMRYWILGVVFALIGLIITLIT